MAKKKAQTISEYLENQESILDGTNEFDNDNSLIPDITEVSEGQKKEDKPIGVLDLKKNTEYTIVITKKFAGQKIGTKKIVSGFVAMALIKKGVAALV